MSSPQYLQSINVIIDQIVSHETPAIVSAARCCANAIAQGGVVHCFGTGHSALLAADAFYRARRPGMRECDPGRTGIDSRGKYDRQLGGTATGPGQIDS